MAFGKPNGSSDILTEEEKLKREEARKARVAQIRAAQAENMGASIQEEIPSTDSGTLQEEAEVTKTKDAKDKKNKPDAKEDVSPKRKNGRKKSSKSVPKDIEDVERISRTLRMDVLTSTRLDLYCAKKSAAGQKMIPGDLIAMLLENELKKNDPELLEVSKQWLSLTK